MKLIIPSSSAGKIIGKSGCNIKEMKEKYDLSVRIQNHEESIEGLDERIVTVKGSPESIEKSVDMILSAAVVSCNSVILPLLSRIKSHVLNAIGHSVCITPTPLKHCESDTLNPYST